MPPFNPVSSMLRTLVALPRMHPSTQEHIYAYGTKNKDTKLLAELASRPDLEEHIDGLLGTIGAANVRAAWLGRPGRTLEQVETALENETRSSVIKSLAGRDDLPQCAYALLVGKLGVNSLPTLISNTAIDQQTLKAAVERYAELSQSDARSLPEPFCTTLAAHPELADTVLEKTHSLLLIDEALNTAIPTPEQAKRIAQLLIAQISANPDSTWRTGMLRENVTLRIEPYLQESGMRRELADTLAAHSANRRGSSETIARLRKSPSKYTPNTDTLRVTTSERVMTQALDKAKRNNTPILPLLAALAVNPACSPELFAELTVNHTRRWNDRALWRSVTDPAKAAALYCAWPWTELDSLLARTSDPGQTLRLIIERTLEQNHSISGSILSSAYLTADIAHELPIETFGYGAECMPVAALEAVESLLIEHLDSPEAWDTLAVIGRDYRGPLGQLLQTAKQLS